MDAHVRKHKKKSAVGSPEDDQPSSQKKMSKKKGKYIAKNWPKPPSIEEVDSEPEVVAVNDDMSEKTSKASIN